MIVIDTETTGLIEGSSIPLEQQPRIIEFAAVKINDDTLKRVRGGKFSELTFLVQPGIPLPKKITEITGLTDADLKDAKPWAHYHSQVVDFFLGERVMVAHNMSFDAGMLELELRRIDRVTQFPWPPEQKCTVEATQYFTGKYLSLDALYQVLFDKVPDSSTRHRALDDVGYLIECIRILRHRKMI